jgi:dienelactone hydrolase
MLGNCARTIAAAFALSLITSACANAYATKKPAANVRRTTDGVEFAILGDKPASPAPTVFVFAHEQVGTLTSPDYNKVGQLLARQGFISVSLDVPAHGNDNKEHNANGLVSWPERIARGDDLVGGFTARCSKVLDHLIKEGYTDPKRVAVAGTSRGGFLALHFVAIEPRVRCVAAFAPVTELLALSEFNNTKDPSKVKALDVSHVADKLAGRPAWLCIGNNDQRVGTDRAIAFTREVVRESVKQKKPAAIELHVTTVVGHTSHPTAHDEAAAFIASKLAVVEDVKDRACLFFDDRFAFEQHGLVRTWHQGRPRPEPAIVGDAWDGWPHLFGSVVYDPRDKLYRMWYSSIREGIFYAESRDGQAWTKPRLGLVDLDGSRDNNCVMSSFSLPNVLLDSNEKDPAARFKLFAWDHQAYRKSGDDRLNGHTLFRSGDGVHWQRVGQGIPGTLMAQQDRSPSLVNPDTNEVSWDSIGQRFLATFRTYPQRWNIGEFDGNRRRSIGVTTAKKIDGPWQPITTMLATDARDDAIAAKALGDMVTGEKWAELYCMPPINCGNHYVGLLSILHCAKASDGGVATNLPGGGRLELTFSHDGLRWRRAAERQPLVAQSDSPELHPCYAACSQPLAMGNEMWIYYAEANSSHPSKAGAKSQIRAATWRTDGFVSLDANDETEATLVTPAMKFEGSSLRLNAACDPGGSVRVAIINGDAEVKGFDDASCDAFPGDDVAHVMSWHGKSDLSKLAGKPVRLRISLSKARLYSFRFASTE